MFTRNKVKWMETAYRKLNSCRFHCIKMLWLLELFLSSLHSATLQSSVILYLSSSFPHAQSHSMSFYEKQDEMNMERCKMRFCHFIWGSVEKFDFHLKLCICIIYNILMCYWWQRTDKRISKRINWISVLTIL